MGADLIGYFAIGPRKLDDARMNAAIAEADRRLHWLREAQTVLGSPEPLDHERIRQLLSTSPYLLPDTELNEIESFDIDQLHTQLHQLIGMIDDLDTLTGKAAVDRVIREWPPYFRDSASIPDPESPDRVIVFAGELSWGDTPEGAGFRFLGETATLGIAETFGIYINASFFTLVLDTPQNNRSSTP